MSESMAAGVAATDVLRIRFRKQVARYRELVARAVDTGGILSDADMAALVELCDALVLPPDRFEHDREELSELRNVEAKLAAVQVKNATVVADVPALEKEIAKLAKEAARIRDEADVKCQAIQAKAAELRREIHKEERRYREPTHRWEREIIERRDANPVLFQRDVEPGEWGQLLKPRKRTIRG